MEAEARFVDIAGRKLYARVSGSGPTVVLNAGGGREGVGSWSTIEARVAQFATVVTYDRAGLGRSPPPVESPTAADMAADLGQLLSALEVPRPVFLVGYSMSSLLVQLYACQHPQDVAGLLLLDPTPDELFSGFRNVPPAVQSQMRSAMLDNARNTGAGEAAVLEMQKIFESCEQVWHAVVEEKRMPDVEVVVISSGIPEQVFGKSMGGSSIAPAHQRMVMRVKRGRHLLSERSSHRTLLAMEADLIIETIRSICGLAPRLAISYSFSLP